MLNKNTIGQAVYRPLIGSIAGFGIGATTSLYSDEEFNPIPWMIMGAGAGYISKKINNAKFITKEVKMKPQEQSILLSVVGFGI